MTIPLITVIPNSVTSPNTFSPDMDTLLSELNPVISAMNTLEVAGTLSEVQDTSTSSIAIGTGEKVFTITAGKSFVAGMTVLIADAAAPSTNSMLGTVTSYSGTTLTMSISATVGSGTKASWIISQSAPGGATLTSNTFSGLQTFSAGANIASATAIDLTTATGNTVVITGTTESTSLAMNTGQQIILLPSGAWPMTFHATTMNINGGEDYTCAAGDRVYVTKDLAGVIRVSVIKQDGTALVSAAAGVTLGSPVATTSGTAFDYTGLPSGLKRITLSLEGVSLSGNDDLLIQIGDSGGLETSGYTSTSDNGNGSTSSSTSGFILKLVSSNTARGSITLTLMDESTNTWVASGVVATIHNAVMVVGGGKALSGVLDRIRVTKTALDTFDAGKLNISYE